MDLKNKSVMVVGGAGFIGSHLVDRLVQEKPEELIVVDNLFLGNLSNLSEAKKSFPKLKFIKADASDYSKIKSVVSKTSPDVIYDLAVIPLPTSLTKPKFTCQVNHDIALNLAELARLDKFKTLIHFSSSEAYGSAKYVPIDEHHELDAETPYASSKAAGDLTVLSYYKTFGIDTTILRPFNNYGPKQNDKAYAGIIPVVINNCIAGKKSTIFGSGKQTRDFIYVTDTAEAAIKIYKSKSTRGKIINIGSGKETSVNELVSLICKSMNFKKKPLHGELRPADVMRHKADIKLARKLFNFKPEIKLEQGLKQTINWYLNKK